jgi:hypothetical protein
MLGTRGGPAWTPSVISALSVIAGGASGGVAELRADELRATPPMAADIEAASMDRLDIAPGPCAMRTPGCSVPVRLGDSESIEPQIISSSAGACALPLRHPAQHGLGLLVRRPFGVTVGNPPAARPIGDCHTVGATGGAEQLVHRVVGDAPALALRAPQGAEDDHRAAPLDLRAVLGDDLGEQVPAR